QVEGPGDAVVGDRPAGSGGRLRLKLGIEIDKGVGEQILHATITLVDARVVEGDPVTGVKIPLRDHTGKSKVPPNETIQP
ncbi:MAG: hypothetical protein CFH07_01683, partial [Alphaproteobacteria bacterium MarineAlpha3_Bin6]